MDTTEQTPSDAVDQLFQDPSPETETQGTSTEEQATTGPETQTEGAESTQQVQQEEQFFAEVAGRKYPTKEDFVKSHETLLEKSRRLEQESRALRAVHDRWSPWEKWLRENPEFERQLRSAEQKYRTARNQGATQGQAQTAAGTANLPPEILKKIEEAHQYSLEQRQASADSQAKAEIGSLRDKFKLDDKAIRSVMDFMVEVMTQTGLDISAEEAYWRIQHLSGTNALAKKEVELQRVKSGDGPVTTSGARAPGKKRLQDMNQREFDAELVDQVNWLNLGE